MFKVRFLDTATVEGAVYGAGQVVAFEDGVDLSGIPTEDATDVTIFNIHAAQATSAIQEA